jgi:hypothetical protein
MFRMSEELAQDLNRIAEDLQNPDSEDESENDEFRDWEAVSSSNSGNLIIALNQVEVEKLLK